MRSEAYMRVQKKVDNLKGFYIHLFVYLIINSIFLYIKVTENMDKGDTFLEALLDSDNFGLWILWGIGLVLHGINVFITNGKFGQDWEERKIKEFMSEDTRNWK
ncbi:2TM domain-containing protein [Kordia sp. YSTF-M3]|uniref:2TM domain-containing protein n=2 Tax=Kordia aestuariivivens TaxID=2759037 RepID=A0ABR7Q5L3_9FLAO|nr:2TM domain-containing protein [Kordia aestuariivivens]